MGICITMIAIISGSLEARSCGRQVKIGAWPNREKYSFVLLAIALSKNVS